MADTTIDRHLEPAAVAVMMPTLGNPLNAGEAAILAAVSTAVSLKRIADALEKVTGENGSLNAYFFVEAAEMAGRAFERGRR